MNTPMKADVVRLPRVLYRVNEVCGATSISKAEVYRRIRTGELPSVRIGRSIRIPAVAFQNWVEHLQEAA